MPKRDTGQPSELSGKYIYRGAPDRDWHSRFTVNGTPYGECLFTKNRREAETKASEQRMKIKGDVRMRERLGADEMLWTDACRHFLLKPTAETDMETQVAWLRDTVAAIIGDNGLLSAITKKIVSDVRMARTATMRRDHTDKNGKVHYRAVRPKTVNKTISLLRRIMYHARNDRGAMIQHIKWADHMTSGGKGKANWTSRAISKKLEVEILNLIHPDYVDCFCFGILCGQRAREFLHLKWREVDLDDENPTATVDVGGGEKHTFPLSDAEVAILRRQRGKHPVYVFTFAAQRTRAYGEASYVKGERVRMSYGRFNQEWRKVKTALELEGIRLHDLRHTAAMRMLAETGDIAAVSAMLNHADISTTQIYAQANAAMVRKAKQKAHGKPKSVTKLVTGAA